MGIKYNLLGHNTVRGAAGASILNAELVRAESLLPSWLSPELLRTAALLYPL